MSEAKCIMHIPYLSCSLALLSYKIKYQKKKTPTETPTKKQEVTLTVL